MVTLKEKGNIHSNFKPATVGAFCGLT